jgi:hypothetical protein
VRKINVVLAAAGVALLTGCQSANDIALKVGKAPDSAVQLRSFESRRFSGTDENVILTAATQTLQDLGYTVTESSAEVGVISAAKDRDARETGQIAGTIALSLVAAALGAYSNPTWDESQAIHVTLVATPVENSGSVEVRVSFDRYITNNHGLLWRTELIQDQKIYQEFFDKLSAGAFLQAQKL